MGAILDLGHCLDFTDARYLALLPPAYKRLAEATEAAGGPIPENLPLDGHGELLMRKLDCAVISMIHQDREDSDECPFDSVRGVFWEGDDAYPNAGFKEKNHIQIAVRNPNSLKGFFIPRSAESDWDVP